MYLLWVQTNCLLNVAREHGKAVNAILMPSHTVLPTRVFRGCVPNDLVECLAASFVISRRINPGVLR